MESKVMGCNRCGECYDGYHDIRKSNHINFTCGRFIPNFSTSFHASCTCWLANRSCRNFINCCLAFLPDGRLELSNSIPS